MGEKSARLSSELDKNKCHHTKEIDARQEKEKRLVAVDHLACPKELSDLAKKEWRRVMRIYKTMDANILNDLDLASLGMYCEAVANWTIAQRKWKETLDVTSAEGIKNIRLMNEQVKVVLSLCEQLCLTPLGRARMGIAMANNDKHESALRDFLKEED